jgi:hypothetical protein
MSDKNPFRRLKAAVAVLAVIVAVSAPVFALVTRATGGDYDEARNRAQLEKIGRALQLYRAEHGFVEPARRQTYSDAGLPPYIAQMTLVAGKPWSLVRADIVPATHRGSTPGTFSQMYWGPDRAQSFGDVSTLYRTRGEQMIVLMDVETDPSRWRSADGRREALVLRLNGTVEKIRFSDNVFLDWSTK